MWAYILFPQFDQDQVACFVVFLKKTMHYTHIVYALSSTCKKSAASAETLFVIFVFFKITS